MNAGTSLAATGYANAGQVCISNQRVITAGKVYSDFLSVLNPKVSGLTTGNQLDERTKVGPMIREDDAIRVEQWVREAVGGGARVTVGGQRQGAVYAPTVVADVNPEMRISSDELFGAAVVVSGNPGCSLQIERGLKEQGINIPVVHPVELLDWSSRGQER